MIMDPIADFLTRMRNAVHAGHDWVEAPASRMKANIAKVLKEEGYLRNFRIVRMPANKYFIRVYFRHDGAGNAVMQGIRRLSRPGLRSYCGAQEVPLSLNGAGTIVMTTPRGVMSGRQARKEKVGGELVCEVW